MDELTYSRDISMWCRRVSLLVDYIREHDRLIESASQCDSAYKKNVYWVKKIRLLVTESSILRDCVDQLCPALLIPHSLIISGKMYTDLELYHVVSSRVGDMNPSDLADYKIPTLGLTIWELSDRLSNRVTGVYGNTLTYIKSFESSKSTHGSAIPSYPIYGVMCISDYELFQFWLSEECDRRIKHKIAFPYTWFNARRSMTMNCRNGRMNEYRTSCMNYMNSIYDVAKELSPNALYGVPPEQYIKSRNDKRVRKNPIKDIEKRRAERLRKRTLALQRRHNELINNSIRREQERHRKDEAKKAERLHKKQLRENNRIIARCARQRELAELREQREVLREAARATRIREKCERAECRRLAYQSHRLSKQDMPGVNQRNKSQVHEDSSNQVESINPVELDNVTYIPGSRAYRAARERMIAQDMIASVLKNSTKIFAAADKNKRGKKPPIK